MLYSLFCAHSVHHNKTIKLQLKMHVVCLPPTHGSSTYTQQTVYKYMPHAFKHIIHFIHCNIFDSPHKGIVATTYVLNPVHNIMLQPLRRLHDQEARSKMLKHNHNRTCQNSQGRLLPQNMQFICRRQFIYRVHIKATCGTH